MSETADSLKRRIATHYDTCSSYYFDLWGQHIHHGYWVSGQETKDEAQTQLIELLINQCEFKKGSRVLDVGCGLGGTSLYLTQNYEAKTVGITISEEQVVMATKLAQSKELSSSFALMDAEKMNFSNEFDYVWITEAMSHMPNKELFFSNAYRALLLGGCLVVADWLKAEDLSEEQIASSIKPIEDGMLLPPLCSMNDYVNFGSKTGFKVKASPLDISANVSKTWDISWELVRNPSLWKLALTQGGDVIKFVNAFQAMRNGYSTGVFRYGVIVFEK